MADNGILSSMGSVGDSYDNALMENFIDGWYNTQRIQKELGWLSPDEYEAAWHAAQAEPPMIPASPTGAR